MVLSELLKVFVQQSPVTVMMRATLENVLSDERLDGLFLEAAVRQRPSDVLFSLLVDLMGSVVCNVRPSIHAAIQARHEEIEVSMRAIYGKLQGVETRVSRVLVRDTAQRMGAIIQATRGRLDPWVKGYRVKILDGNHLPHSERRLGVLRPLNVAPSCRMNRRAMTFASTVDRGRRSTTSVPTISPTTRPNTVMSRATMSPTTSADAATVSAPCSHHTGPSTRPSSACGVTRPIRARAIRRCRAGSARSSCAAWPAIPPIGSHRCRTYCASSRPARPKKPIIPRAISTDCGGRSGGGAWSAGSRLPPRGSRSCLSEPLCRRCTSPRNRPNRRR